MSRWCVPEAQEEALGFGSVLREVSPGTPSVEKGNERPARKLHGS
jgi:hypothetical protein